MATSLSLPGFEVVPSDITDGTYLLQSLEVFNWGPFSEMHRASIDPLGTAIVGPTGSGKTTLIDALMTLLVAQPRYNLASTGGHESDRDLVSYVQGVLGGDGSTAQEEVARPGKTISGICATYGNGGATIRLGGLLWFEGANRANADLKRRWIVSTADGETLEGWLRTCHEEGVRHLMRHGRETAKLRIFDSKKAYLAHVRKIFDVGENAFTLLNRAAGLKQLNSIDEIFRDLVLDDRSAFNRALEVASEFDTLAEIRAELEIAKRQQDALLPVEQEWNRLGQVRARAKKLDQLRRLITVWFATVAERRWAQTLATAQAQLESLDASLSALKGEEQASDERLHSLQESYLKLGGNWVAELERRIQSEEKALDDATRNAEDYRRTMLKFELDPELSASTLQQNQLAMQAKSATWRQQQETQDESVLDLRSTLRDKAAETEGLQATLEQVKSRPGSNIPPAYQDFRSLLAQHLGLADEALPFVAELVEVKPEARAWRGAIERALGAERLRLLVPEAATRSALDWVNQRDNRLHVRLQAATENPRAARFFDDGMTRKLNFKTHPLRETLKHLLAARDRHCVDSVAALEGLEHAMTREGLMSDRQGRFDKQDQRPLNQGWMTGFDNKDQVRALTEQLTTGREQLAALKGQVDLETSRLHDLAARLELAKSIMTLAFESIDVTGARASLETTRARLNEHLDPDSDTARAKRLYDEERLHRDTLRERANELVAKSALLKKDCDDAERERDDAAKRARPALTQATLEIAKRGFPIPADAEARQLPQLEREARDKHERAAAQAQQRISDHERRLVRFMERAHYEDTGALADTGTELTDIEDYLERLRVLNEEALPEKLQRFLGYLNRSSDQGVTQLLAAVAEEVDSIEHRVQALNATLTKVDFRSGRYLQLQPRRVQHERLRALERAQRYLRSAALKDDQGESHYKALRDVVEVLRDAGQNRRQLGARALLDPRYRLSFLVVEVDRETGKRSAPRTGSQAGSGGEKELMASHILTASLSYALCPAGAPRPLYGTVILDEAFSKSSPSAASRIIEALRVFGLHPIFVTPNKELGLLKRHTRRLICVQRPNREASLASISWEQLEQLAQTRP